LDGVFFIDRQRAAVAHVAIVGPGAVGGVMAAWLASSGHHTVTLCARRPIGELVVTVGERQLISRPAVVTEPERATPVDWLLVTTKAYDAAGAARWLPTLTRNDTPVAILQNGVEHRERFASYLPAARIVPVMVDCPAERTAVNQVRQRGTAKMVVGDDPLGRSFAELFADTEIEVTLTADLKSALWRKLCLNAAGAVCALLLKPAGIMRDEKIGDIARGLVRECIAVGRSEGAVLDDSLVESVLAACRNAPADSVNSLHADRAAGRPMETDARNGVIVRLGRKHGLPTPYNEMTVALLEAAVRNG
jgi:2-dehydropantoate 2-reductase